MLKKTLPAQKNRAFQQHFPLIGAVLVGLISLLALGVMVTKREKTTDATPAKAANPLIPNGPIGQTANWTLIFNDEFDGAPLDTTKWANCIHWGITPTGCWENLAQLEWYLPANTTFTTDAGLNVVDLQTKLQTVVTDKGTFNYTSGLFTSDRDTDTTSIPSKFSFTYGFAEIRAKLPKVKGVWPAFWMLPSDRSNHEIDIMEVLGHEPAKTYMTYHWNGQQDQSDYTIPATDFSADYHTFAVDWEPDSITWYVDGVAQKTFTNAGAIANMPMYLIANTQVGGPWAGDPDPGTVPADGHLAYLIDYIRVWKKDPIPTATPTLPADTPTPTLEVPSPTLTAEPSPSPSPLPSPTVTVNPTTQPTPVPSLTPTGSLVPNPSLTVTPMISLTPAATPTAGPLPTPSPTRSIANGPTPTNPPGVTVNPTSASITTTTYTIVTTVACNQTCSRNSDCANPAHICSNGRCRLDANPDDATCHLPTGQTTVVWNVIPSRAAVDLAAPAELLKTGPADWLNWLWGGLGVLGAAALLLLLW